jgi:hypothetical protein
MERQTATKNKQESINSSSLSRGILQRKCACGNQSAGGGECGECGKKNQLLQRRAVHISEPGDRYEQEADRMAVQVMSMSVAAALPPQVQGFGEEHNPIHMYSSLAQSITPVVPRRVNEQVQMYSLVQRAFQAGGTEAHGHLEGRLNASKGGGSALSEDVRSFMEQRFGADFSSVRVHTGGEAVQMNRELGAQAFTHGSDVYYGGGKAPGKDELTAHELTHVVQQTGGQQYPTIQPDVESEKEGIIQRQLANSDDSPNTPPLDWVIEAGRDIASQITIENLISVGEKATGLFQELFLSPPNSQVVEKLLSGWYENKGQFSYSNGEMQFDRPELQQVLNYQKRYWASSINSVEKRTGDTEGKAVSEHPQWVSDFQEKLINKSASGNKPRQGTANWDQDSRIAQRLVEAYLQAWTKGINNSNHVNSNIEELYEQVGASVTNQQAIILGGVKGAGDWCDPATVRAIVLGLMKNNLRFKTGKIPVTPDNIEDQASTAKALIQEISNQSIFFHLHWYNGTLPNGGGFSTAISKPSGGSTAKTKVRPDPAKLKEQERQVNGKDAWTAPLRPGDSITVVNGTSPLSGHVATVIKEEFQPQFEYLQFSKGADPDPDRLLKKIPKAGHVISTIQYVSGNAKGGGVRTEEVKREIPPDGYDYFNIALPSNAYNNNKIAYHLSKKAWDKSGWESKVEALQAQLMHEAINKPLSIDNLNWISLANDGFNYPPYSDLPSYKKAYQAAKEALPKREAMIRSHNRMQRGLDRKLPTPVSRTDDLKFQAGKHAPATPNHSWVVVIVRASLLDAKSIIPSAIQFDFTAGLTWDQSQLDKLALEPLGSTIESLYPGALEFLITEK